MKDGTDALCLSAVVWAVVVCWLIEAPLEIEVILASGLGLVSSECQNRLSWSVSTRGSVAPARRREGRLWTADAGGSATRAEAVAGATGFSAKPISMPF